MRIVARSNVIAYGRRHPLTEPSLRFWLMIASKATWRNMNDVSASFRNCKVLDGACWIKFLGTHKE